VDARAPGAALGGEPCHPALVALALVAIGALGVITSFLALVSRLPLPVVAGSSVLWWVLVPLGAAAIAGLLVTRLSDARIGFSWPR